MIDDAKGCGGMFNTTALYGSAVFSGFLQAGESPFRRSGSRDSRGKDFPVDWKISPNQVAILCHIVASF
jgi:hypothetical protein